MIRVFGIGILITHSACTQCGASQVANPQPSHPSAVEPAAPLPAVLPLPERMLRGIAYAHDYQQGGRQGYGSPTSRNSLEELRDLGATAISLMPFGFMRSVSASEVHGPGTDIRYASGETDNRLIAEIQQIRALGFQHILLKPHIWIHGGWWRGNIAQASPEHWNQWWSNYENWILHYAQLAQAHQVDSLAVGVELSSTSTRFPDRWRALIQHVRERYDGELVYSANWDEVERIQFWDALDAIGVQFYPPLSHVPNATPLQWRQQIEHYLDQLETVHVQTSLPILFTEVGYKSIHGSVVHPYTWPEQLDAPVVDETEQANAYRVLFSAVRTRSWFNGLYLWKWFTNPHTHEEGPTGFSPRGKEAEAILREAYAAPAPALSRPAAR